MKYYGIEFTEEQVHAAPVMMLRANLKVHLNLLDSFGNVSSRNVVGKEKKRVKRTTKFVKVESNIVSPSPSTRELKRQFPATPRKYNKKFKIERKNDQRQKFDNLIDSVYGNKFRLITYDRNTFKIPSFKNTFDDNSFLQILGEYGTWTAFMKDERTNIKPFLSGKAEKGETRFIMGLVYGPQKRNNLRIFYKKYLEPLRIPHECMPFATCPSSGYSNKDSLSGDFNDGYTTPPIGPDKSKTSYEESKHLVDTDDEMEVQRSSSKYNKNDGESDEEEKSCINVDSDEDEEQSDVANEDEDYKYSEDENDEDDEDVDEDEVNDEDDEMNDEELEENDEELQENDDEDEENDDDEEHEEEDNQYESDQGPTYHSVFFPYGEDHVHDEDRDDIEPDETNDVENHDNLRNDEETEK